MPTHAEKTKENKPQSVSNGSSQKLSGGESTFQFSNNRSEAVAQLELQEIANNSPQVLIQREFQSMADFSPQVTQAAQLQAMADNNSIKQHPIQKKENNTGLPDSLKYGIENLSGYSMDDVKVHYNSDKPAQIQAHAYAHGNQIHVANGQEKHLPHEAWHVVQQKQGRVLPTGAHANGEKINDDAGLEKEADQMGEKIATGDFSKQISQHNHLGKPGIVQQKVVQRKKVATDFGEFETTQFTPVDDDGVEITLFFYPDKSKVDAKKIALSQSVKTTLASGGTYAIDPSTSKRMVGSGKSGEGYAIDRLSDRNNPVYGADSLAADKDLKDIPQSGNTSADVTKLAGASYQLGQCYKANPTDADKTDKPAAALWDRPRGGGKNGESKMFETTALAIDGTDKGKYYGSVKWGFKIEGTEAAPTLTTIDIEKASLRTPTVNFMEPAKLWNKAKTRGTVKVTADPEANGLNGAGTAAEKIAKDTKLKQMETVMWGADPAIKAEVLAADGTGSGKIVYIKNVDIVDAGDGAATKQLPIVNVKIATTQIEETINPPPAIFNPSESPMSSPMLRIIPANTRVELIFDGSSSATGDKLPQVKVLEGPLTGSIITISLADSLKLKNE